MTEEGIITDIIGNRVLVLTARSSACASCGNRGACKPLGGSSNNMEVNALNTAGSKIGDRVMVGMGSGSVIKIALLVYIVPVIALFAGVYAGLLFGREFGFDTELSSLLFSVLFFVLTFIGIRILGNKLGQQQKYTPEVTRILSAAVKK